MGSQTTSMPQLDLWLERAHGIEDRDAPVTIFVEVDGGLVTLDEYQLNLPSVPEKYPHWQVDETPNFPLRIGVDQPGESAGVLSGKAIYLSQCHGWDYFESLGRFSTQRGNLHNTVEDFHNPEGMINTLSIIWRIWVHKCLPQRREGSILSMDIADNDGAGYSETGTGFQNGYAGLRIPLPTRMGKILLMLEQQDDFLQIQVL